MTGDFTFRDIMYGPVRVPQEFVPFLRIPEFLRLRGVRLSNLDSVEFKDLSGPSRWEHAIGVLHLACICAHERHMPPGKAAELMLAALLHDIATPPFAHTAEYVLEDFDHELETARLLAGVPSADVAPSAAIYLSEAPQFEEQCLRLSHQIGHRIDVEEVSRMVVGEGELGFLISGTLDLDNADNVTRASHYMGLAVDHSLPVRLAKFLAHCDQAPVALIEHPNDDVRIWAAYRARMYGAFFSQGAVERGREAFLQHLFRRAVSAGIPRRQLVWNTDEGLLNTLEAFSEKDPGEGMGLRELVRRYRLIEDPVPLVSIPILDHERLQSLSVPVAATWIEAQLTTPYMEAIVSVARNRFGKDELHDAAIDVLGELRVFKLGRGLAHGSLPKWAQDQLPVSYKGKRLESAFGRLISSQLNDWAATKPWSGPSPAKSERVRENLEQMGDWAFRATRNVPLHTYPSTFVQAIPSTLIHALGVAGEIIVDPFGGTGNTAVESIRVGGSGVSGDSNSIACLIARTRVTYLTPEQRGFLRGLSAPDLTSAGPGEPPSFPGISRWHAADTIWELTAIRAFIGGLEDAALAQFLTLCFSAVLPETTARRGLQHGFFADNTPLSRGAVTPPYVDATELFLARVRRNVATIERLYAALEHGGGDVELSLGRARAIKADCRTAEVSDFGLSPGAVSAVITSPPYLCMSDYTLGHRLSYHWLGLDMEEDFKHEIGPRRERLRQSPELSLKSYLEDMGRFANLSRAMLRPGGYLAMVLGSPTARAFVGEDVLGRVDETLEEHGFSPTWSDWREISWSRNHGYSRLRRERISVHRLGC